MTRDLALKIVERALQLNDEKLTSLLEQAGIVKPFGFTITGEQIASVEPDPDGVRRITISPDGVDLNGRSDKHFLTSADISLLPLFQNSGISDELLGLVCALYNAVLIIANQGYWSRQSSREALVEVLDEYVDLCRDVQATAVKMMTRVV